jgi:GH15 family glucan-1,4-alpha-glucosidase
VASRIEDYALLSDTESAALVARDGSMDWLTFPRFDSGACFAALLGTEEHGRWLLAPSGGVRRVHRRYRPGGLVLETEFETDDGTVALIDFMPPRHHTPDVVRIVEGRSGRVPMRMELIIRFDYGSIVPWVTSGDGRLQAVAGPEALCLDTPVATRGEDLRTVAEFEVNAGDRLPFVLAWYPSNREPHDLDPYAELERTERWWSDWSGRFTYAGEWKDEVQSSLVVLKALTYAPTGGIVAAATTSLPEDLGGVRNWDYRLCWLRDATFTLIALIECGYIDEAMSWRDWLLRAAAGEPSKLQIMYGPAGERRLTELEVPWLPGYEASAPVRIGNAAYGQFQLDVWGEVMDALHHARLAGMPPDAASWDLQRALLDFLEGNWNRPDDGIWEVRGGRRHFTHSKVMAWVALDRAVRAVEQHGLEGPVDRWRAVRDVICAEVLERGVDPDRGNLVQHYGSRELDASLLMVPLVGFLPPSDPRVAATVDAIQEELSTDDGFVLRYRPNEQLDGLPGDEGAFLMCSFWLADNLALLGRTDEAEALFERLLGLRNDVGLLSEQYDHQRGRMVGNFPQAFSHVSLVNTATNLCTSQAGAAARRREEPG